MKVDELETYQYDDISWSIQPPHRVVPDLYFSFFKYKVIHLREMRSWIQKRISAYLLR